MTPDSEADVLVEVNVAAGSDVDIVFVLSAFRVLCRLKVDDVYGFLRYS
jgi:hypothetical protein